jgi:hypothetical protein
VILGAHYPFSSRQLGSIHPKLITQALDFYVVRTSGFFYTWQTWRSTFYVERYLQRVQIASDVTEYGTTHSGTSAASAAAMW